MSFGTSMLKVAEDAGSASTKTSQVAAARLEGLVGAFADAEIGRPREGRPLRHEPSARLPG